MGISQVRFKEIFLIVAHYSLSHTTVGFESKKYYFLVVSSTHYYSTQLVKFLTAPMESIVYHIHSGIREKNCDYVIMIFTPHWFESMNSRGKTSMIVKLVCPLQCKGCGLESICSLRSWSTNMDFTISLSSNSRFLWCKNFKRPHSLQILIHSMVSNLWSLRGYECKLLVARSYCIALEVQ